MKWFLLFSAAAVAFVARVDGEENMLRGKIQEKLTASEKIQSNAGGYCEDIDMPGTLGSECDFVCTCREDTAEGKLSCHPGFIGIPQKCYHDPRRLGEPCSLGYSCGPGLSCSPWFHTCDHDPRLLNEPCSAGYSCAPGLECASNHVCLHSPRIQGEFCSGTEPCGAGLKCDGFCSHKSSVGSYCDESSDCLSDKCCEPNTGICLGAAVTCYFTENCVCGGTDPPTRAPTAPPNYQSCIERQAACDQQCHGGDCGCFDEPCQMPPTPPPTTKAPTVPPTVPAPTNAPTTRAPTHSRAYLDCMAWKADCDNQCHGGDCGCYDVPCPP